MRRIACQSALQNLHACAFGIHTATRAMRQSDYAINIWKISQCRWIGLTRKIVSNRASCSRGTIHARQNSDVIACCYTPIGTHNALEGGVALFRLWFDIFTKRIVTGEVTFFKAHVEVMHMHMVARRNSAASKANDLVVTPYRLTRTDIANSDFVAGWNQTAHCHMFDSAATHELAARNHHII